MILCGNERWDLPTLSICWCCSICFLNGFFFPELFSLPRNLATTILLPVFTNLTALDTLYKWNPTVFVFCDWFISVSIISSRFIHVVVYDRNSFFFLRLSNIPLYTTFCLCTQPSIDIGLVDYCAYHYNEYGCANISSRSCFWFFWVIYPEGHHRHLRSNLTFYNLIFICLNIFDFYLLLKWQSINLFLSLFLKKNYIVSTLSKYIIST